MTAKKIGKASVQVLPVPRRANLVEISAGRILIDGEVFPHRFSNDYAMGLAGDRNEAFSITLDVFVNSFGITDEGLLMLDGRVFPYERRGHFPKVTLTNFGDFPPICISLSIIAEAMSSDFSIFPGRR